MRKRKRLWPYLLVGTVLFYIGHWVAKLYALAPAPADSLDDMGIGLTRWNWMADHYQSKPWLDLVFTNDSLMWGGFAFLIALFFYTRVGDYYNYRHGEEQGSARFATAKELEPFQDKKHPEDNFILSANVKMALFNFRLPWQFQTNKSTVTYGGSGDGKTRYRLKPNAMQLGDRSYVFTDTNGLLARELGHMFKVNGYKVKIIDFVNFINSDQFNIFKYMKTELDIDRVVNAIMAANKRSDDEGESFWLSAEAFLGRALMGFLYFDGQVSGYTPHQGMIMDLLRCHDRIDPDIPSPLEMMFDELEKALPGNYACRQWYAFNNNFRDGETRNSAFAIFATRYSVFDHDDIRRMIERDTLEIETWQTEKTAVFISIPEKDESFQFLSALLFKTMFDVTIETADDILQGRHPSYTKKDLLHLDIEADEVANIGHIFMLERIIAVIRKREISMHLYLQSTAQLPAIYGREKAQTIIDNCATMIFLGSPNGETNKKIAEDIGNQTIRVQNQTINHGQNGGSSDSKNSNQRALMYADEIRRLPVDETLILMPRQHVFRDKKFNLESHPRYKQLAEEPSDPNWYNYKRYMSDIDEWLDNVDQGDVIELTDADLAKVDLQDIA